MSSSIASTNQSVKDALLGVVDAANRSFAMVDPDYPLWNVMPREPQIWFERFCEYISIGKEDRTILKVYNRIQARNELPPRPNLPRDWQLMVAAWRWKDRATSYDQYVARKEKREEEERLKKRKKDRLMTLERFHQKLSEAVDTFEPGSDFFRLSEITGGLQAVGKEERSETDDQPINRTEVQVTSMADLLRESEREKYQKDSRSRNKPETIIEAEYR